MRCAPKRGWVERTEDPTPCPLHRVGLLSTRRLGYDHHGAAAAMRRAGHANGYARTLVTGLWPSLDVLPPAERAATGRRLRRRTVRVFASRAERGQTLQV
jgi:hypothetical protein